MASLPALGTLFFGRFEILRQAGTGGMGTVYQARDRGTGQLVALKVLHLQDDGAEGGRFLREAGILAELTHPHIVSYIDHGQSQEGFFFLVMEWLDGEDLASRLRRGPLSVGDCIRLLRGVSAALSVAHGKGIVHRDIKPSNLFLSGGQIDVVKVLDFGIARRASAMTLTGTGVVIGTPEYMAPEQARGQPDITPAADTFSLGCVLYECLVGNPPFSAEHLAAVLLKVLLEEPSPILQLRPGTPVALAELIHRMLAKNPAQRPADGLTIWRELDALPAIAEAEGDARQPTLQFDRPADSPFEDEDVGLFSVVLAKLSVSPHDATQAVGPIPELESGSDSLEKSFAALGIQADFLMDGSIAMTLGGQGSASDQAGQAALAALLLKERYPTAEVVMATGRGRRRGTRAVGDVVESAVKLLQQRLGPPPAANPSAGIWLDTLSSRLLDRRFRIVTSERGHELCGDEHAIDESRPLLGKPTPCIGRDVELSILESQLQACSEDGEAAVVQIVAAAGVGKSRLRHAFSRRLEERAQDVTIFLGSGRLTHSQTPYAVIADLLRRHCGIRASDPPERQQAMLTEQLGRALHGERRAQIIEFLGECAGVPTASQISEALRAARHDPKLMQEQLQHAFVSWLAAECDRQTTLLVLDDLHWSDGLSVYLVEHTVRMLRTAPLFILAFARPEVHAIYPQIWKGLPVRDITLKGLSKKASERLIQHVLGKSTAAQVVAGIIEQAEGNTLFLEELIRSHVEQNEAQRSATVVAMLQARVGRLPTAARRALRAASVFGQTFWEGGIAVLLGNTQVTPELTSTLQRLVSEEVVTPHANSQISGESEFAFRHALMQEATYLLLSAEEKQAGHRLAGEFLERADERDPLVLAEHFERSEEPGRAVRYFLRAAEARYRHQDGRGLGLCVERAEACGAQGEALGGLRSLQAHSAYYGGELVQGVRYGQEALALLPAGTRAWMTAMEAALLCSSFLGQMDVFGALFQRFMSTEPDPDAVDPFLMAAGRLVQMSTLAGVRDHARLVLERARQVYAKATSVSPVAESTHALAECFVAHYLEPEPAQAQRLARRAMEPLVRADVVRELSGVMTFVAASLCNLGAYEEARSTMEALQGYVSRLVEPVTQLYWDMAWQYVRSPEGVPLRAAWLAERMSHHLEKLQAAPFQAGLAYSALAGSHLALGDYVASEHAAHEALRAFGGLPVLQVEVSTYLLQALLALGKLDEATALARHNLGLVTQIGGVGCLEVPLRLQAARVFHASGHREEAHAQLHEAHRQIQRRADRTPDAAARAQYLGRVHECVRVSQLAADWQVTLDPAIR